ncbi:hypothetical protein GT348_02510 [Aristophania vespae]|uniref:SPOR domain-containing protein n=2 Tax=Aristophania vespae TaxID=2697033 RepID=A0A6P1NA62_9PROT|nr:SPOR domain-containing protein [Aristophania vespae]QHI95296.1 hypothetical protein GT348_02510 [Aristophania vespae]
MGGALIIVVLLLLAVGGWSLIGNRHHGVPVIAPPPLAVRDRPADPGGMQVMSDDTVKSDVTGKGQVHLAPPTEQPDERVLARKSEQPVQSQFPVDKISKPLQSDIPPVQSVPGPSAPSEPESASVSKIQKSAPVVKKAEVKTSQEARHLPPPKAVTHTGSFQVQLVALEGKEKARQAWQQLQRRVPNILGHKTPLYSQVLHNGRSFTRVRIGGFADLKASKAFCAQLKAHSVTCAPASF